MNIKQSNQPDIIAVFEVRSNNTLSIGKVKRWNEKFQLEEFVFLPKVSFPDDLCTYFLPVCPNSQNP